MHSRRTLWALALVLAFVLFTGWGQMHRVWHPGSQTFTSAEAKATATGLADEDGSSLCHLLDHLSHGTGPIDALALALPGAAPLAPPAARAGSAPTLALEAFKARGPPHLA